MGSVNDQEQITFAVRIDARARMLATEALGADLKLPRFYTCRNHYEACNATLSTTIRFSLTTKAYCWNVKVNKL